MRRRHFPNLSRKWLLIAGIPATLLAFYALAGFVFLPYFAKRYVPGVLHERFGVSTELAGIRFNPFLFTAEMRDVALRGANAQPIATIGQLTADVQFTSLFTRAWTVSDARIEDATVLIDIAPDGRVNLASLHKPRAEAETPSGSQRRLTWRQIHITKSKIGVVHRGYEQPLVYDIGIDSATVRNIAPQSAEPIDLAATMQVAQGGAVEASGTMAQDFATAQAQVRLAQVVLTPLQPLVAKYATLTLASGDASAQAELHYQRDHAPKVRATGALSIDNVALNETGGEPLVAWSKLSAKDMALSLAPGSFSAEEVEWDAPVAKIEISKDRKLNLTQFAKDRGAEEAAGSTSSARIRTLHVRGGTVDFADHSLVLPFAARVHRFNGAIAGISSEPGARAELKLEGLIEDSGAAKAEGALNAFDPTAYTDVRVKFENVEMPTLSPYTATFAGRKIDSGRLWLDLNYHIVEGKLDAENKIVMQQLKLGERVETATALDLPLDLAVALLTDSKGRITLAIPVSGDVNNPQFSYGRLIGTALVAAIKRVVSAPFRALARAFGRESLGVDGIDFEPGLARLMPPEREKLDNIAKALRERPQVKLVVHAPYDPKLDGHALREDAVRRELAKLVGGNLKRTDDPAPILYTEAGTQRSLERLFAQYVGDNAAQEFAKQFAQKRGREPERVNRVLAIVGRGSPDRDFYEAMFNRLVAEYPLPEGAGAELAQHRAKTIADYLARNARVDGARIETADPRSVKDPAGRAVTAKLGVDVLKHTS